MRILLLAPQPFYQERGTPIAVALVLKVLSERGHDVDVVTYHEGRDVRLPRVTLHRIPRLPLVRGIRPGMSWKKLVCDLFVLIAALRLARARRYDLVHAVEEAVFIALVLKRAFGLPYVYDMDSLLSGQLTDRLPWLAPVTPLLARCERFALSEALAVLPVCEALETVARRWAPGPIVRLPDVSLLDDALDAL
ncbi:MAG TPA: glycosyltransferase [Candidatus Tectomicrobia bacterium]|nr:glycosyltransferase [Candidatus Tectomicrobia bacterium]